MLWLIMHPQFTGMEKLKLYPIYFKFSELFSFFFKIVIALFLIILYSLKKYIRAQNRSERVPLNTPFTLSRSHDIL